MFDLDFSEAKILASAQVRIEERQRARKV